MTLFSLFLFFVLAAARTTSMSQAILKRFNDEVEFFEQRQDLKASTWNVSSEG
jgi:hypothetical protein